MRLRKCSCELLAFILYLCSLKQLGNKTTNWNPTLWIACIYLVSLLFETTERTLFNTYDGCELLAFILYLCSLKQQKHVKKRCHKCCELLAFILYLCSLKQPLRLHGDWFAVVNCLHLSCIFALWNNLNPTIEKLKGVVNCLHLSCIFALWNNHHLFALSYATVVNCLHLSCIFALWNNNKGRTFKCIRVVNCLHLSCIFALWNNLAAGRSFL